MEDWRVQRQSWNWRKEPLVVGVFCGTEGNGPEDESGASAWLVQLSGCVCQDLFASWILQFLANTDGRWIEIFMIVTSLTWQVSSIDVRPVHTYHAIKRRLDAIEFLKHCFPNKNICSPFWSGPGQISWSVRGFESTEIPSWPTMPSTNWLPRRRFAKCHPWGSNVPVGRVPSAPWLKHGGALVVLGSQVLMCWNCKNHPLFHRTPALNRHWSRKNTFSCAGPVRCLCQLWHFVTNVVSLKVSMLPKT